MPSSTRVLCMAAASGVITYGLVWLAGEMPAWLPLPSDLFRYAPGLVFGAMVMQLEARDLGRRAGIVLACGLIWILMYRLASHLVSEHQQSTLLACGIAGGLGAWLVSLVVRLLRPRRLSLLAMLMAFVTGTIGACLIGQGLMESEMNLLAQGLMLSGFIAWQVGVGGSLLLVDELGENEHHA